MSVNGKGRWDEMFAQINESIQESEQRSEDLAEAQHAEDVEVPEQFREAAPNAFDDDQIAQRKAEAQAEEDAALKRLNIVSVYKKLTGNEVKRSGGQNEKLVFCPTEGHNNRNSEAACLNTSKNTWVCYGQCEDGGGVIDMVAAAAGMPFGKQLKGKEYAKAKQKTLEDFCGWRFDKTKAGYIGKSPEAQKQELADFEAEYGKLPQIEDEAPYENPLGIHRLPGDDDLPSLGPTKFDRSEFGQAKQKEKPKPNPKPVADQVVTKPAHAVPEPRPSLSVVAAPKDEGDDDAIEEEVLPEIEDIFENIPEGTPLHEYMRVTANMPVPKEFSLFRGLQLLSLSAGPFIRGRSSMGFFKPTLSVLFVGITGSGKSQSKGPMDEILSHPAYKYMATAPNGSPYGSTFGVKRIKKPGSGEWFIKQMSQETSGDDTFSVRDVMCDMDYDEFAHFMGKGSVTGSSLITVFQEIDNNSSLDSTVGAGSISSGKLEMINPNVVLSSGVQPGALAKIAGSGNVENGLLARFEIITGNKLLPEHVLKSELIDTDHCQDLYTDLVVYYKNKVDPEGKTRKIVHIPFDKSVYDYIHECYLKIEDWKRGSDIKSRFDLKFLKLCLLFTINRKADVVMREDIDSAMWVMEYLNRAANLSAQKIVVTHGGEIEEKLIHIVTLFTKGKKGYATSGDINDRIKRGNHPWDPAEVHKRLESLIDRGEIVIDPRTAARGPKSQRYIVPSALGAADLKIVQQAEKKRRSK